MAAAGEAITTTTTHYVTFTADNVAYAEVGDVRADLDDLADEFVPDGHGHWYRLLGPSIPFKDMHVGTADTSAIDADQHIVDASGWFRNIFQPQSNFTFALNQCLHCCHLRPQPTPVAVLLRRGVFYHKRTVIVNRVGVLVTLSQRSWGRSNRAV